MNILLYILKKVLIGFGCFTVIFQTFTGVAAKGIVSNNRTSQDTQKEDTVKLDVLSEDLLNEINDLRADKGLKKLTIDEDLEDYAGIRAKESSSKWSHTRPNGEYCLDEIPADKYAGENLSMCYNYEGESSNEKAEEVMFNLLCESSEHYKNMVSKYFSKIGISVYVKDTEVYVAYIFSS